MYAIDPKTKQYVYPKAPNDCEFYKTDSTNKEVYVSNNDVETYAFNPEIKQEFFATDDQGVVYYAKYDHKQIYPIDLTQVFEKFIRLNQEDRYTENRYKFQFYPLDWVGCHKVAQRGSEYVYAKGESQKPWYPLNEYGHEFIQHDRSGHEIFIFDEAGYPIAPKKRNGSVHYPKINDAEIPYMYQETFFLGKNAVGDEQYPLDNTLDEYYPDDDTLDPKMAKDHHGRYKYALFHFNKIRYPYLNNEQTYITDPQGDSYTILMRQVDKFERYVAVNGQEKYPIKTLKNNEAVEMLIQNLYAQHNGTSFYPKDSKNNEYVNAKGELLKDYPKTSDGQTIIPNHENEPVVKANDTEVTKHIQCLLYRPEFKRYDFLINCASKAYPLLHSESFSTWANLLKYVKVVLCTLTFLLFLILLVK